MVVGNVWGDSLVIYIRPDGSIDPPTSPIKEYGNIYTLTDNIVSQTIVVQKSNTTLDGGGFTLQGSGAGVGIDMTGNRGVRIQNFHIIGFSFGISLNSSDGNTICGNVIQDNDIGILLTGASYNTIINNTFIEDQEGARFSSSDGTPSGTPASFNTVGHNTIKQAKWIGIASWFSSDNILSWNTITQCQAWGMYLCSSPRFNITANTVSFNGNDPNRAGIDIYGCDGTTVSGNYVINNYNGINVNYGSINTAVWGNDIRNNKVGVYIYNNGAGNSQKTVTASANGTQYTYITIDPSTANNNITHNNLANNTQQISIDEVSFINWNSSEAASGNYWSSYQGADLNSDGVGDTPYLIDQNNIDYYPLVNPVDIQANYLPSNWNFTEINGTPAKSSALISLSANPTSCAVGQSVTISGQLVDGRSGVGLANKPIRLIFKGENVSGTIATVNTDADGNYSYQWTMSCNFSVTIRAEFDGDDTWNNANTGVNILTTLTQTAAPTASPTPALPDANQTGFLVESNSTVTALAFNSKSSELSFTVTGKSGTTGYIKVTIAKAIVADAQNISVMLDGAPIAYSLADQADSWLLTFSYHHSTHQVDVYLSATSSTLNLQKTPLPSAQETATPATPNQEPTPNQDLPIFIVVGLIAAVGVLAGLFLRKKP